MDRGAAAWLAGAVGVGAGLLLAAGTPSPAGLDGLELEDAVDAVCLLVIAAVGLPLLGEARRRALGLALCSLAPVLGAGLLLDGAGRALYEGGQRTPGSALLVMGGSLLPLLAVLVVVVIPVLAPTGAPRWAVAGRLAQAAVVGAGLLVVADVLQAGPVDEDATGLGANPLGIDGLSSALDVARLVGGLAVVAGVLVALASVLARLVRDGSDVRRRTAWVVAGVGLLVGALALDGALQARGGATYGVIAAAVALLGLAACLARAVRQEDPALAPV